MVLQPVDNLTDSGEETPPPVRKKPSGKLQLKALVPNGPKQKAKAKAKASSSKSKATPKQDSSTASPLVAEQSANTNPIETPERAKGEHDFWALLKTHFLFLRLLTGEILMFNVKLHSCGSGIHDFRLF